MGVLNEMVARSDATNEAKGFNGDWEDAAYLDGLAEAIEDGRSLNGDAAEQIRRIADQHRMLVIGTKLALVMSECCEALESLRDTGMEGLRRGQGNIAEEVADAHIRLFGMAALCGFDTEAEIAAKQDRNAARPPMHGRKF